MNINFDIEEKTGKVKISTTINGETRLTCKTISGSIDKNALNVHIIAEKVLNQFLIPEKEKQINVNTVFSNGISRVANQNPYFFDESTFSYGRIDKRV